MKKRLYYLLFVWSCLFVSCSDEDENIDWPVNFDSSVVQEADDFIDSRDNATYRCVRIGNQIWMAENLHFQSRGYSFSGCYTWNESMSVIDLSMAELSNAEFKNLAQSVADDPKYNTWPQYKFLIYSGAQWIMMNAFSGFGTKITQADVLEALLGQYPDFYTVFIREINLYKMSIPEKVQEAKLKSAFYNFKEAEAENGGYVSTYGCLYSYPGALLAVPTGWRLPTDEDWTKLETALGMNAQEATKMEAWRGAGMATLLDKGGKSGFDAVRGGANVYVKVKSEQFINKGDNWYYWSSTVFMENDSTAVAMIRMSANYTDKVWRGTSRISTGYRPVLYNVRCVKDIQ